MRMDFMGVVIVDNLRDIAGDLGLASGQLFTPAPQALCHKMVAQVAKEAAGELYDELMHDNVLARCWRQRFPGMSPRALEKRFIAMHWGRCIPFARTTLALMLRQPIDPAMAESIMDALVKDNSLQHGRPDLNQLALSQLKAEANNGN